MNAQNARTGPEAPADPADPRESARRARNRRRAFAIVGGLALVAGIVAAVAAPLTTADGNSPIWAWALPPVTAVIMVGALGWLAVYVLAPGKGRGGR